CFPQPRRLASCGKLRVAASPSKGRRVEAGSWHRPHGGALSARFAFYFRPSALDRYVVWPTYRYRHTSIYSLVILTLVWCRRAFATVTAGGTEPAAVSSDARTIAMRLCQNRPSRTRRGL